MEKHTKGPYFAVQYGPYFNIQNAEYYGATNLLDLQECKQAEANAKLIASAPLMKEALQLLLKEFNEPDVQMKTPIAYYKAFRKAEAALSSATL